MSYIRALGGFAQHRDSVLLLEAYIVLTAMEGNPHFPDSTPSLAEVESAYNEYLMNLVRVNWTPGRVDRVLKRESKARLATLLGEQLAAMLILWPKVNRPSCIHRVFPCLQDGRSAWFLQCQAVGFLMGDSSTKSASISIRWAEI
ncbi:hypothetical protein FAZ15_02195 [Sphingobacterium olei]|uniref:Uncharacterized protein n=1 Tax=Sphingobacterium olei TaxID=2571155 RepID=A0A4U0P731_9SPHI|nr:hypothetical protein [Sphingobacterium olei]TJZ63130.1 hypothetical protein FAZ15_02195 [Sphingobacterium olei]